MQKVMLSEAREQLEALVEAAINGETVLIEIDSEKVVQVIPFAPTKQPRRAGSAVGLMTIAEDFDDPLEDFAEYME
ncbi:MAG: DUF2281 domain-containing protein [Anaerolineae bacterium]|nr:DUF2281 domain-containing protein [Anaerolineae bacterium]